jgi:hypothetical protein
MSLLDYTTEDVIVFPEVVLTDADGNIKTQASKEGVWARCRFQVQGQSGTSARRAEQDLEGYATEKVYTVRFPRGFPILGAQSVIEWRGQRWSIFGDVNVYNSSPRTAHHTYTVRRT